MVGEGAVKLEIHLVDRQRQCRQACRVGKYRRCREPRHAVAGIHNQVQRSDCGDIDKRAKVPCVVGEHVLLPRRALGAVKVRHPRLDHGADFTQTGILAHRCSTRTAQLDSVVLRRIVTGGEHRARKVEVPRGEVQPIGTRQADEDHIAALLSNAGSE